jgi:hypothetical protein
LLERTFAIDVLACPECDGRLRLIATISDTPARGFRRAGSSVIDKILTQSRSIPFGGPQRSSGPWDPRAISRNASNWPF